MTGLKVETVLGPIKPTELGPTLTHEHLFMDFKHFYAKPPAQLADKFPDQIVLNQVGYLKQYPYSSLYNLSLNDEDTRKVVLKDVADYKKFGGGAIAENSTEGLRRNLDFFKKVSKETGVHVIAGTGFYIADLQQPQVLGRQTEDLYHHMLDEMTVGCRDDSSVKTGFVGEVASVWPLRDFERSAIRATGELQSQLRCGVSFHPHRVPDAPFEIIRLYLEAGGNADKAVMSHLDRTLQTPELLLDFAALGTYCQFDLFGVETSYYQLNIATDMPSDAQRLDRLKILADEGYEEKLLMSHDVHTKHRLSEFGGHGYSHVLNNVVPRMPAKGFTNEQIHQITVTNPANWLAMPA